MIALDEYRQERRRRGRRKPTDVDRHVAAGIRRRRKMLGLTQQQAGEMIGTTYQQFWKYENGTNRISIGQFYQIAKAFAVPVAWFFEGLDMPWPAETPEPLVGLLRDYQRITDPKQQAALRQMARVLAR